MGNCQITILTLPLILFATTGSGLFRPELILWWYTGGSMLSVDWSRAYEAAGGTKERV